MVSNNHHATDNETARDSQSQASVDVQFYLRVLRKYKWPISMCTLLATLLATFYAYTSTPIYKSQATLLIESQKPNLISLDELYTVDNGQDEYLDTQLAILKSRVLASRVVVKLGLVKGLDRGPNRQSAPNVANTTPVGAAPATEISENTTETSTPAPEGPLQSVKAQLTRVIKFTKSGLRTINAKLGEGKKLLISLLKKIREGRLLEPEVENPARVANAKPVETDPEVLAEKARIRAEKRNERRIATKATQFLRNLTIAPVRNTNLIKISYENANRDFAAVAANAVAEEYILSVVDARTEIKSKASAWLYERLSVLKEKLDASESNLFRFKQENGLVDVNGSVERLNERELMLATTELASARIQLSAAEDLYREVQQLRSNSPELLESLPAIQNDTLVRSVKIEYGQRQREFDELSNRYGLKHPKMLDAQSRLDSLRSTLDAHISRAVSSIEQEFQLQRQRVASIESTLSEGKQNIQLIGQKKFRLDALEREVAANQELYDQFFNKISRADSADGLDTANARISDYAIPTTSPVKPRKQLIITLAALASLLLSVTMAFLYEKFDDTIKSSRDVEFKLGVPLLGIIPLVKKGFMTKSKQLPLNPMDIIDKKGTFAESVNTIQTELSIGEGNNKKNQVILVTSSVPGEGKSSSALNLAYAFSQIEKVLMIDCDMRRPSLAKSMGEPKNTLGLSNLITGSATPAQCIHRNGIDSIDILPSGPIPDKPLVLLSCARFEEIINQLKKYYDRIIIDSAPTQAVSDALKLSKFADSVVYVVKSNSTSLEQVKRGLDRLTRIDAPIAGILVSQVDVDKIAAYGGDYDFQGYYDYYGYNGDEVKSKKTRKKFELSPSELTIMRESNADTEFEEFADIAFNNGNHSSISMFDGEFDLTVDIDEPLRRSDRWSEPGSARRT